VITNGDLIALGTINFCISATATRCDVTAATDCLGNVFTATTAGNNQQVPGNPTVSASILYSLATHPGTECATNAFTLTLACGACVIGDSWDAEWLIYEYSNAVRMTNSNYVDAGTTNGISTLNAPITTTLPGDAIFGFAYGSTPIRPLIYQSSQTNQHSWVNNAGYPYGDLEGLSTGAHNYAMGTTAPTGAGDVFLVASAEITSSAPAAPPNPLKDYYLLGLIGMIAITIIPMTRREDPLGQNNLIQDAIVLVGMLTLVAVVATFA